MVKKLFLVLFFLLLVSAVFGADESSSKTTPSESEVGVKEKLGKIIPEGIYFYNSKGEKVEIKKLVSQKPTVIAPVYYKCTNVCNILQSKLTNILPQVKLNPGKDYQVLSVSFDHTETPAIAGNEKKNYMAALPEKFGDESWKFLTGDKENIDKLMNTIGFNFKKRPDSDMFIHPVALILISTEGKIVRYLYGTRLLPFDLTMAIIEAQKGNVGVSVKRVLSYCFDYDPKGRTYVFNVMRVSGTIIIVFIVITFLIIAFGGKKKRRKRDR